MGSYTSVHKRNLESFEELNGAVPGSRSEVVQIERGRLGGYLTHASVGDLPLHVGSFSVGVRSRGVLSDDHITIGMLTGCTNRVTHWSREMRPADILVTPPGVEHDGRYFGGASFAVMSLNAGDVRSIFGSEPRLRDFGAWQRNHFRPDPHAGAFVIRHVRSIVSRLEASGTTLTVHAAEFWKRSIVEAMTTAILSNMPSDRDGPLPSALLIVQKAEDYIDINGLRPIHISEICSALHVSRRTLHRAFHEALGIGPVAFVRYRRLCSIHSALRSSNVAQTTVADVALQHGFLNLGRFSGYYRSLFGEYPAETLRGQSISSPKQWRNPSQLVG